MPTMSAASLHLNLARCQWTLFWGHTPTTFLYPPRPRPANSRELLRTRRERQEVCRERQWSVIWWRAPLPAPQPRRGSVAPGGGQAGTSFLLLPRGSSGNKRPRQASSFTGSRFLAFSSIAASPEPLLRVSLRLEFQLLLIWSCCCGLELSPVRACLRSVVWKLDCEIGVRVGGSYSCRSLLRNQRSSSAIPLQSSSCLAEMDAAAAPSVAARLLARESFPRSFLSPAEFCSEFLFNLVCYNR